MTDLIPMPPMRPPAKPSAFGRLIPVSMREKNANAFLAQAEGFRNSVGIVGLVMSVSIIAFFATGATASSLMASALAFALTCFMIAVVSIVTAAPKSTKHLPDDVDARPLPILAREMIRISEEGLADRDRGRIQQLVDDASHQIRRIIGAEPWTIAVDPMRSGPGLYVDGVKIGTPPKPETLGRRGVAIRNQLSVIDNVMNPEGTEPSKLRAAISQITPRVASICADFGLDPVGFAERERILPGMRAKAIEQLPDLAADARRLADEWLGGDREGIDPMLRIDADRAAGQELETLSRAWERARASATPETLDAIDADMRDGCRRICATLSAAIGARGRSDRDALGIQTRFLESKHGDDVLPGGR